MENQWRETSPVQAGGSLGAMSLGDECFILTGEGLTVNQCLAIIHEGTKVDLAHEAIERLEKSRALVFKLADSGIPIYGFTVGVGWNKDKQVFGKYFEEYNRNLIYAHCVGVGPYLSEAQVRGVLLARLNTLLSARTGIQLDLVHRYKDFLNLGIHPLIPTRGSVGEGDIANLSHIGLAMLGEGDVYYKGLRRPAMEALVDAGLEPVVLGPKDGLSIVSSNAVTAGQAILVLEAAKKLLRAANEVYALSVEGLDGNITPLRAEPNEARKMPSQISVAAELRELLKGSYLWEKGISKTLQDPLCFRCAPAIHGALLDAIDYAEDLLEIQLNASDDNPCIVLESEEIISSCNFEITNLVLAFEMLGQAVGHVARSACHRTIKLSNPEFTKLPRFLSPREGVVQAYQTIQKPFTALDAEIRHLMNPVSTDYYAVAGDMEDHATNGPYVMEKTLKIIENAFYILGIEAMHAAQAIDLRSWLRPDQVLDLAAISEMEPRLALGEGSYRLYQDIRNKIPFLQKDRPLTPDIEAAYQVLRK